MALTISTGFVVDDAIVMIENIARYIEEGDSPLRGRAQGRRADRLHDRVADGLADRGADPAAVHGRHRRAGCSASSPSRSASTILISAVVSLTLTPMMCATLLRHAPRSRAGRASTASSERGFERIDRGLRHDAALGARPSAGDAAGRAGHAGADRRALRRGAQGLLPGAGHRRDPGHLRGAAAISFAAMAERQQALAAVDPAGSGRREPVVVHRRGRHQHDAQQRAHPDQPEAAGRAARRAPSTIIRRLQPQLARGRGHHALSCSRCRT